MKKKIHISHLLRKYDPKEWAGTEITLKNLLSNLDQSNFSSKIYCPELSKKTTGPFEKLGIDIERFPAFLPIWGLQNIQKERLLSIGGNLMSFHLPYKLLKEENLDVIHTHTLGLIGVIGKKIAKYRKIPFIVSLHGGALDLPEDMIKYFKDNTRGGLPWGKILNILLQPGKILNNADAIIAFNQREVELLQEKFPKQRIEYIPHGLDCTPFQKDCREYAIKAFPILKNKSVLLTAGRVDPVKNQKWLIEQLPLILKKFPNTYLAIAGPITNEGYFEEISTIIKKLNLGNYVGYLGNFLPYDQRLVGLFQHANAFILPSIAEPFGMVILESWASKTPVISSKTSGGCDLIENEINGFLFDLNSTSSLLEAIYLSTENQEMKKKVIEEGYRLAQKKYNMETNTKTIKDLYLDLLKKNIFDKSR